jgi:hypothetical protein
MPGVGRWYTSGGFVSLCEISPGICPGFLCPFEGFPSPSIPLRSKQTVYLGRGEKCNKPVFIGLF